jgi:hypothetical protein
MYISKKKNFYTTYIELEKLAMEFSIFQFFQINHLSWVNLRGVQSWLSPEFMFIWIGK